MARIPSLLAAASLVLLASSTALAGLPFVDDGSSKGSLAVLPVPPASNVKPREAAPAPDSFVEGAAAYHIRHARDLPSVDYDSAAMKAAGMRVTLPVTVGGAAGMPGAAKVAVVERRTEGGGAYLLMARDLPAVDFDFAGGGGSGMSSPLRTAVKIAHTAMNIAAIIGPMTKPLSPNTAMPPSVEISTM